MDTLNVVSVWFIFISLLAMILYFSFSPFSPSPVESAGIGRGARLLLTIMLLLSIFRLIVSGFVVDMMLCLTAFSINICSAVGMILIDVTATSVIGGMLIFMPSPYRMFSIWAYCCVNLSSSDSSTTSCLSFDSRYR